MKSYKTVSYPACARYASPSLYRILYFTDFVALVCIMDAMSGGVSFVQQWTPNGGLFVSKRDGSSMEECHHICLQVTAVIAHLFKG